MIAIEELIEWFDALPLSVQSDILLDTRRGDTFLQRVQYHWNRNTGS